MPLPPELMGRMPGMVARGAPAPAAPEMDEGAEKEGDEEEVSPEMVKAGVACLKANKAMKPAELVAEIYKAMEGAEPEEAEPLAGPA